MFNKNKYRETANNASEKERILPHNFRQSSNRKMRSNPKMEIVESQTSSSSNRGMETVFELEMNEIVESLIAAVESETNGDENGTKKRVAKRRKATSDSRRRRESRKESRRP